MLDGKLSIGNLIKNSKKIQEMFEKAQDELSKIKVQGESGVDMVKLTMTAQHHITSLHLSDELLKQDRKVIEELIIAACNDANLKVSAITKEKMLSAGDLFSGSEA